MRYLFVTLALLLSFVALGAAQEQPQYPNSPYYNQAWNRVLSPTDQQQFDKYYGKWVDATRKNDQDDITSNARHMQEIMSRYNIPASIPFDQIASYPVNGAYPYPTGAYPYPARLSADDQAKFDKEYSKWLDAQHKNDLDDVSGHALKMRDIMARYNIPQNVPFAAIATNGYAAAPPAYPYPPAAAYGYPPQRLSAHDQKDFDKAYRDWVHARQKRDMDDIDKNARKMEDIMARYNIPANVPFDQVASPNAAYR